MTKIVECWCGVIGGGKSYNSLISVGNGYELINFADEVREVAWMLLGWRPSNNDEYELFKNMEISLSSKGNTINEIYFPGKELSKFTGRDFLIRTGDGFRERYGKDYWVDKLINKINRSPNTRFVIGDLRFCNEAIKLSQVFDSKYFLADYKKSPKYQILPDVKSEKLGIELSQKYFNQDQIPLSEFYFLDKLGFE